MRIRPLATLAALSAFVPVLAAAPGAHAATINVESAADEIVVDSTCTLREAVQSALQNTGVAGCEAGGAVETDTIVLPAGAPYQLTRTGADDTAANGDLDLGGGPIVIDGGGADGTIVDGGDKDRVFQVLAGTVVEIEGVTVRNGSAPDGIQGFPPPGSPTGGAGAPGGGIRNDGALTLRAAVVSGNDAGAGGTGAMGDPTSINASGGGGGVGGDGGGIYSVGPLTVVDSRISGNTAGVGGTGGPGAPAMTIAGSGGQGGAGGAGGGIAAAAGTLTLQNSEISANSAGAGGNGGNGGFSSSSPGPGGHGGAGGRGGGVQVASGAGPLDWHGGKLADNDAGAGGDGGTNGNGVFVIPGGNGGAGGSGGGASSVPAVTLAAVTVDANTAGGGGGAGFGGFGAAAGGAGNGGGLALQGGGTLAGVTLSSNTAGAGGTTTSPGGVPATGGQGGGLATDGASLTVQNSTFNANRAGRGGNGTSIAGPGGGGGAIAATAGLDLRHVTVAGNAPGDAGTGPPSGPGGGGGLKVTGGTTTLANSIVTGNGGGNCEGAVADGGNNVSSGGTCPGSAGDPLLGPLADNGGPTRTMAPADGSAAIDLVPAAAGCLPSDQRGVARPQRAACDAGAVEREGVPGQGGTGGTADTRAPTVTVKLIRQRLRRALRRGYRLRFGSDEAGTARLDVFLPRGFPRAARRVRVARGSRTFAAAGSYVVTARFTKRAKRRLARARSVRFALRLAVSDRSGNVTVVTRRVKLRR